MSDDGKTQPDIKHGDHLGTINGEAVKAKVDAEGVSADVAKAKESAELTHDEHHAALVKRETVTLVLPARSNPLTGYRRAEVRKDVVMTSLRCAVAYRVLHGMSPDQRKQLEQAHAASEHKGVEFDKWALRHIEENLPVEVSGPALQKTLAVHAHADKLKEHRKGALAKLAKASAPASAAQ